MFFSKKTKGAQPAPPALIFPELLEPISEAHPCGSDLEYDPELVLLQSKVTPKQDAQYGDFVSPPEAINWTEVERDCRRLLQRTRDIRILVSLVRCRVRLDEAFGLRDGLCILSRLLETWPETIYPQVVVDGEPDPAVRANALAALADPQGLMQDVRDLVISTNGALRLRGARRRAIIEHSTRGRCVGAGGSAAPDPRTAQPNRRGTVRAGRGPSLCVIGRLLGSTSPSRRPP